MKKLYFDGNIVVKKGDITLETSDAIVNAANPSLLGGGGVDGAIHRGGGPAILEECKKIRKESFPEGLPRGQAVATTAGKLSARYVIHTVGPIWHQKKEDFEILAACYRNSLDLALKLNCRSISFPAISTGVYGFPSDKAAEVVIQTLSNYKNLHAIRVFLIFYSISETKLFIKIADQKWS